MDEMISKFFEFCNPVQLIGMGIILYVFYKKLDKKMDKKFEEVKVEFKEVNAKIDRLDNKIQDIDKRLCKIEGSLSTHGHCLFHQQSDRKAG